MSLAIRAIGAPLDRIDGPRKVTGGATYAYEYAVDGCAYAFPVQSTIAKGKVTGVDASDASALAGVFVVFSHEDAPRLADTGDPELAVLQSDAVAYHGQIIAGVVADSYELARAAAALVRIQYAQEPHDVAFRADHPGLYKPEKVNAGFETDTAEGDVDAALTSAATTLDHTYTTPYVHNQPLEPHATIAQWTDENRLLLHDANQGSHPIRADVAAAFGLEEERVRVIAPYVGGAFGSKAFTHPHVIFTAMAAKVAGRPVKVALTRQQMFSLVGYRTPTIQRLRLGADRAGKLVALSHDVVEQTSKLEDFAEQTAIATRMMYAATNRRTTHRLVRLDVPTPSIMRAPGECPGMFGLESAMDEMAEACGLDPIEFRIRNEPQRDPDTGRPFSSRNLVACLREGPAVSAGRTGMRDPVRAARAAGASAPGSRHPRIRRGGGALRSRTCACVTGGMPSRSMPRTSARARGPRLANRRRRVRRAGRAHRPAHRRQRLAAGARGGRIDGSRVVGFGRRRRR